MTITFYDIPSKVAGSWTPNTWKGRIALNYKGLPYKTVWLEFPDIETELKKLGAPPTGKKPDGSPSYTLPVIHDPKTGKYISDSWAIAEYLDATYPDTPQLFPHGTAAAVALFQHVLGSAYVTPLVPLIMYPVHEVLNTQSQPYFRTTREASFGCKLEELAPAGADRDAKFGKLKEGLALLAGFFDKNGKDTLWLLGDTFTYADVILASFLLWAQKVFDPKEWEAIASWDDGRWGKVVAATAKYQSIEN